MKKMKFEEFYELRSFIGRGSFGEVRKCICRKTDEILAVKEIQYDLDNEARDKAENEAEVMIEFVVTAILVQLMLSHGKVNKEWFSFFKKVV